MLKNTSELFYSRQSAPWMQWWYSFTVPKHGTREIERKARLLSIVVFLILLDNIWYTTSALISGNKYLLFVIGAETVLSVIALMLNRRQATVAAGVVVTLTYTIGIMTVILPISYISLGIFAIFSLLIIPEIIVAALLPPVWVLVSAAFNVTFIFLMVQLKPHAADLSPSQGLSFFFIMVTMQLLVAGISFVLMRNLLYALRQRDSAEEYAILERQLAISAEAKAQEKEQLELSIRMIVDAQTRFANGDMEVRVPLNTDNVLWSVGGALNNLFLRLQRQQEASQDVQRVIRAVDVLHTIVVRQRQGRQTPLYVPSGTIVDQLAMVLLPSNMFEQDKAQSEALSQRSRPGMK